MLLWLPLPLCDPAKSCAYWDHTIHTGPSVCPIQYPIQSLSTVQLLCEAFSDPAFLTRLRGPLLDAQATLGICFYYSRPQTDKITNCNYLLSHLSQQQMMPRQVLDCIFWVFSFNSYPWQIVNCQWPYTAKHTITSNSLSGQYSSVLGIATERVQQQLY